MNLKFGQSCFSRRFEVLLFALCELFVTRYGTAVHQEFYKIVELRLSSVSVISPDNHTYNMSQIRLTNHTSRTFRIAGSTLNKSGCTTVFYWSLIRGFFTSHAFCHKETRQTFIYKHFHCEEVKFYKSTRFNKNKCEQINLSLHKRVDHSWLKQPSNHCFDYPKSVYG